MIHKGYKKNQDLYSQLPVPDIKLSRGWHITYCSITNISHGDIIEYDDGSREIYDGTGYNLLLINIDRRYNPTSNDWFIDMDWKPDADTEGYYNFMLLQAENYKGYEGISWLHCTSQNLLYILDKINRTMSFISSNDMNGLQELKDKYHEKMPNEDLYNENPKIYLQQEKDEEGFLDKDIGVYLRNIVYDFKFIMHSLKFYIANSWLNNISDYFVVQIKNYNPDLAAKILAPVKEVKEYLKKQEKTSDLTEYQRVFIKSKLEPLRQYLIDNYK